MEFEYRLFSIGWAAATITHGDASAELTASYLSNALGDLLAAVAELLAGAEEARCSWDEEPGEFRWVFARSGDQVALSIEWFNELWSDQPDGEGRVVFAVEVPLLVAARCIEETAQSVLDQYGEQGYLEKWHEYPFPLDVLRGIKRKLSSVDEH